MTPRQVIEAMRELVRAAEGAVSGEVLERAREALDALAIVFADAEDNAEDDA